MQTHDDVSTGGDDCPPPSDSMNQAHILEEAERAITQRYLKRHHAVMSRRHDPDDLIPLHVLNDTRQHAVVEANSGRVAAARAEMTALDTMELSPDPEIQAVSRLCSFPIWALIWWRENSPVDAIEWLHCALHAGLELAVRFGHDYLTGKQIHLACNIARVLVSAGDNAQALAYAAALRDVVAGDRERWPFEGKEALDLPLEGVERMIIERQLDRIELLARSGAPPPSGAEPPVDQTSMVAEAGSIDILADPIRRSIGDAHVAGFLDGWSVIVQSSGKGLWSVYTPRTVTGPETGFKIHVSASISCVGEVLARTIPILTSMGIPFKHVPNLDKLSFFSSGKGGLTQIGKFLTAYPPNPDVARELAQSLHKATAGLRGPRILSEPSITPDSLVHYRYGGFSEQWLQLRTGQIVPARTDAEGRLEYDDRNKVARTLVDGDAVPVGDDVHAPVRDHVLRGRYIRVRELYRGPKGSTWVGFGTEMPDSDLLVIKEAYAYMMEDTDGVDAIQRLAREAASLKALGDSGVTPVFIDYWEEGRSAFLVYELVDGPTFASILSVLATEGLRPTPEILTRWTVALCDTVAEIHRRGYVIADIKPSNLIFTGNSFRVIDLETAREPTALPAGGMGTQGYSSPQQSDPNSGLSFLDDVYSIGATMLSAAILTDVAMLPHPVTVARLEGSRDPDNLIYPAIEGCLAPDPERRIPSPRAIVECITGGGAPRVESTIVTETDALDFMGPACAIGDLLIRDVVGDGEHAFWASEHMVVRGRPARDLYAGSAGTALFLCELYHATGRAAYLDVALRCGRWLVSTPPIVQPEAPMPGLYFGACGPGLLYLRLHQLTGDDEWLARAIRVGEDVRHMPSGSPDIMTGTAGVGLYHLALWRAAGDGALLDHASSLAHTLLEQRLPGRPAWVIPPGYGALSGNEYTGFGHGSAGIAYFLAECCLARGDGDLAAACAEAADWIIGIGRSCLADGSGLRWGANADDDASVIAWCHGAAGIARFLLKAYEVSARPEHLLAAERAGNVLATAAPWNGTTQCHGLAGNAEVLIDIARAGGMDRYLTAARRLGENLAVYRTEKGWPSEDPQTISPDLMVGQAGVGAAFIRLAHPERPHIVSMPAFSMNAAAGPGSPRASRPLHRL